MSSVHSVEAVKEVNNCISGDGWLCLAGYRRFDKIEVLPFLPAVLVGPESRDEEFISGLM